MKPEIKAAWVAALRSGKYKQGMKFLNRNGAFCCLGVLCELAKEAGVTETTNHSAFKNIVMYSDKCSMPPTVVYQWSGLSAPVVPSPPNIKSRHNEVSIAELNDEYNYTFDQLADLIERHL